MMGVDSTCSLLSLVRKQYPELMDEIGDAPVEIVSVSKEVDDIDRACARILDEAEQWNYCLADVREFTNDILVMAPKISVPKHHCLVVIRANGMEYGMTVRLPC